MTDSRDRHDSTEQRDATPEKEGGFGAFSKQYRDRWAANHPRSRRIHGDVASRGAPPVRAAERAAEGDDRHMGGGPEKKP